MTVYIIPATTVLLSFLALITCVRFLFSRQGLYWIFPVFMSALSFYGDMRDLLELAQSDITRFEITFGNFYPFLMAILWILMVSVFHHALTKHVEDNRFEYESRRNRKEAEYLEKAERRSGQRKTRQASRSGLPLLDTLQVPVTPHEAGDVD